MGANFRYGPGKFRKLHIFMVTRKAATVKPPPGRRIKP
jgi:hypothetical protein